MAFRFPSDPVWQFRTKRFVVALEVMRDHGYRYDGDDEDGTTQAALDCGDLVAFDSRVYVMMDGEVIASDWLHGSVYKRDDVPQFWREHRSPNPMHRNSSIMRAKCGANSVICHYFPGMVLAAIHEARQYVRSLPTVPYIRESAL